MALLLAPQVLVAMYVVYALIVGREPYEDSLLHDVRIAEFLIYLMTGPPAVVAFIVSRMLRLHPRTRGFVGNAWAVILLYAISCGILDGLIDADIGARLSGAAAAFALSVPVSLAYCAIAGVRWR